MMKKLTSALLAGTAIAVSVSSPAWADGTSGKGAPPVTGNCTTSGTVTIYASSGESAWVTDQHWVVQTFSGTLTAPDGEILRSFTKTDGNKTGFGSTQECRGVTIDKAGNTFSFDVIVAPNPNH
jgi:hypothetical protein